jgi:UNC-50 family
MSEFLYHLLLLSVSLTAIRLSRLLGNTLYLVAFAYYTVITFLGYNGTVGILLLAALTRTALPFMQHTELILAPVPVFAIIWLISIFSYNAPRYLAPVLWAAAELRKGV